MGLLNEHIPLNINLSNITEPSEVIFAQMRKIFSERYSVVKKLGHHLHFLCFSSSVLTWPGDKPTLHHMDNLGNKVCLLTVKTGILYHTMSLLSKDQKTLPFHRSPLSRKKHSKSNLVISP